MGRQFRGRRLAQNLYAARDLLARQTAEADAQSAHVRPPRGEIASRKKVHAAFFDAAQQRFRGERRGQFDPEVHSAGGR